MRVIPAVAVRPSSRVLAVAVVAALAAVLNVLGVAVEVVPPSGQTEEVTASNASRPPGFDEPTRRVARQAVATSSKPPGYGTSRIAVAPIPQPPSVALPTHPDGYDAAVAAHAHATFEGLSTWVDLYDTALSPQEQVRIAAESGVDVVFAQASFSSTETALHAPERLHALIEAAHDRSLRVMVWTIPDFVDVDRDFKRAEAAIGLVTPRGDRPDAFGLDIEMDDVADVAERTRRLLDLSQRIRAWVGDAYPMAAIVLPPLQLRLNTTWWPGFPYAELAEIYDVMIPMSYSSFRGEDVFTTLVWNRDNVTITKQLAGDMALPVHLAGGIADDLPEVSAFVEAVEVSGAIGGGLYDLHTTPPEAWGPLARLSR